jgi:hypothetical protein
MNVFRKLWLAVENLAASMNCFAVTIDAVSAEIRLRSGLSADTGPQLIESNGQPDPSALPTGRKRARPVE